MNQSTDVATTARSPLKTHTPNVAKDKQGIGLHISDRVSHSGLGEGIIVRIEYDELGRVGGSSAWLLGVRLDNANTFSCPARDVTLLKIADKSEPVEIKGMVSTYNKKSATAQPRSAARKRTPEPSGAQRSRGGQ